MSQQETKTSAPLGLAFLSLFKGAHQSREQRDPFLPPIDPNEALVGRDRLKNLEVPSAQQVGICNRDCKSR